MTRAQKLLEAYQGRLYHATGFRNAFQALKSNTLKVSPNFLGVSFSRSPVLWYRYVENPIRFILDGTKLSHNYQLKPFNYAGDPNKKVFEFEIIVEKDIKNLKSYLLGIEVRRSPRIRDEDIEKLQDLAGSIPVIDYGRVRPTTADKVTQEWPNQRFSTVLPTLKSYKFQHSLKGV